MKKLKLLSIILICLLFTACGPKKPVKPKVEKEEAEINDELTELDEKSLEPDINFKEIKMTDNIQKKKNIDYLLNPPYTDNDDINSKLSNLALTKDFNEQENYRFNIDIKYDKYLMPEEYFLITKEKANIYENPSFQS